MTSFDNSFRKLPAFLFEDVTPTPLKKASLVHVTKLKDEIGLGLSDDELALWLNGEKSLPGEQRIASRYAGHQFGVWAGQLGDGRAISLGELVTPEGRRYEIQTKGSGLTPFSRMGDGKAVIRSSVREYLCSEAMHGLGIPTTRVLALLTGEDPVYREEVERSAVVARVFPSNIRFGHFELCYHFQKKDELKALIDYTRSQFYPQCTIEEMLGEIVRRTANLMADWMGVGFCHGVMNTDNMSILGLTIDYGPFGFLEDTVLNYICNHSDHQGRYAYSQQPEVAHWNLSRLLVCFLDEVPQDKLQEILNAYPTHFEAALMRVARRKLGLSHPHEQDAALFMGLLQTLHKLSIDFTYFFRQLSQLNDLQGIWDYYGNCAELREWMKLYEERLTLETGSGEQRKELMLRTNPKYVLKNYIAQEVIEDVEKGSSGKLRAWLEVFYAPFEEHPAFEAYALPTPPDKKDFQVSCSS